MAEKIELTEDALNLAVELRDYIRDRAAVERVPFGLPLGMFAAAVKLGWWVFGVYHDGKRILRDEREPHPGYFRAWMAARGHVAAD